MKKYSSMILLGSAVLSLVINIIFYNALPEKVGLQFTVSGDTNNVVPKIFLLIMAPIILILNYLYDRFSKDNDKQKSIAVALVIFILNIITIFVNFKKKI